MNANSPPRPSLNLSVGITGHRPPALNEEAEQAILPLLKDVLIHLREGATLMRTANPGLFEDGDLVPRFVSALAEGADQIGASVALELGYRLDAVLPLPRDDYRTDFEPAGLESFDALLAQADHVLELPPQHGGRHENYSLAGRATVAHCDVLVALWDGEPARGIGGTAEVVALALRRGVPVIHLPTDVDDVGRIMWTGYGDFIDASDLSEIPTQPIDTITLHNLAALVLGPPTNPQTAHDLKQYLDEREWRLRPRAEYPLLLAALGVKPLRKSAFSSPGYEDVTRAEWESFRESCGGDLHGVASPLDGIERSFAWADRLAQHFAQIYRSGHVLNFTFGALAVVIALNGLVFSWLEFFLAAAETSVLALLIINTMIGSKREWHRRWLEYRHLAELIRPMRSLKLLGAASPSSIGQHSKRKSTRWTDWYAQAIWREAGCPSGQLVDPAAFVKAVVAEELTPQIDYHRHSAHQMHKLDHRLHLLGTILFFTCFMGCLVAVFSNLFFHDFAHHNAHFFIMSSAGMPAMGGAIFGMRMQGDFGGTALRSLNTADELERIAQALGDPQLGLARQVDLMEAAAATMLADLAEWRHAYERRELHIG